MPTVPPRPQSVAELNNLYRARKRYYLQRAKFNAGAKRTGKCVRPVTAAS